LKPGFSRVLVVLALATSLTPRGANAAAGPTAESLVNQAVELRRNGDDEGALALLLKAYGLGHAPRATGQLGLCEQALGRWADAEVYLTETLKAEGDPWVKKNRRTLEDALAIVRAHVARIELQGEPEGAEVWVNGALAGRLPLASPVRVAAGEVEVELRAPGFVRETKTMRLEAGQYQRIVLHAGKPSVPAPPAPPSAASSETTTVVVNVPETRAAIAAPPGIVEAPAPAASSGRLALKWVAWGLGAAAAGVGVYGSVGNSSGVWDFDAKCGIDPILGPVDKVTGSPTTQCKNLQSNYQSKGVIGVGGFVAAGALAVTGVVLWLTEPSGRARDVAALPCAPALGERLAPTLGCALRF
jgi:hypothetical protein